jgi:hypothetical protein
LNITNDGGKPFSNSTQPIIPQKVKEILFENGSRIELVQSGNVIRGKRYLIGIDLAKDTNKE